MIILDVDFQTRKLVSRVEFELPKEESITPLMDKFLNFQAKHVNYQVSPDGIAEILGILDELIPKTQNVFKVQLLNMKIYYEKLRG